MNHKTGIQMAYNIGGINFTVDADTDGITRADTAMEKMQETARDTGRAIDGVGDSSKETSRDLKTMSTDAKGAADGLKNGVLAATAFAGSLALITKNSAQAARDLKIMAELSSTSVEQFQKLAFGAKSVGIESEQLGQIFLDVQDRVGDFLSSGGGEMADYFENVAPLVGQTAEQFRNLSGPQALQLFQQGLEKANLSASQQRFYMESMASDATRLIPLLRDGGRGFEEYGQQAEEMGVVLSGIQIENLTEVDNAFNELGTTISRTTSAVIADNAPAILAAINDVTSAVIEATKFIKENIDEIQDVATILGTAAAAYASYRVAVLAATAAQAAFNIAARANPIGLLVTAAGTAIGLFASMADNTKTAADRVEELTGKTKALNYAEKQLLQTKLEQRVLERQKELEAMKAQLVVLQAQRNAETDIQKAGRGNGGEDALETMKRKAEDTKTEIDLLNEKIEELKVNENNSGADSSGDIKTGFSDANKELQDLIDKYNPLLAEERELLAEQAKLNKAFDDAGGKNVPAIATALIEVGKQLDIVRGKMSGINTTAANTEFQNMLGAMPNNLPATTIGDPIVLQKGGEEVSKGFFDHLKDSLDDLAWDQYGQELGGALGQALVSGDSGGIRSALGGIASAGVADAAGSALTGALTASLGAGAASFLGPIGGGIAGAVAEGLIAGKQEVSRSVEIVFSEGIAQASTRVNYESMLGGSSSQLIGFSGTENEMLNNTLRNATQGIDDILADLGQSINDFSGTFEGADIGAAVSDFTESYVDAGFGSIEAFQRLGESAESALSRVTGSINELNDAIRGVVGQETELAVQNYTQQIADQIDFNSELTEDYWNAVIVALRDIADGALEPLAAAEGDLIRGTENYQRAFSNYLATSSNGRFQVPGRMASADELIQFIEENQLPEAVSRLGEGVVVATADFAEQLQNLVDGGDVAKALESLTNVIASDAENYANTIDNLKNDLTGLGFSGDITAQEFAETYNEAIEGVVTPATLSRFANAAMLIEDIAEASEGLVGESFAQLRKSIDNQRDIITDAYNDQRDEAEKTLDTLNEGLGDLRSTAESLRSAIEATVNESATVRASRLSAARNEIARLADSGVIPSSDKLDELLGRVTGNNEQYYKSAEEYYFEQGKTANDIAQLSSIADDQLSETELQIENQERLLELLQKQYDADMEDLEDQLQAAQDQVDILNDSYIALIDIKTALGNFELTIEQASGGDAPASGPASSSEISDAYSYLQQQNTNGGVTNWDAADYQSGLAAINAGVSSEQLADSLGVSQSYVQQRTSELGLPAFANGGTHFGGLMKMGEIGTEVAQMPAGTHITTAADTRKLLDQAPTIEAINTLTDRVRIMAGDMQGMYNLFIPLVQGNMLATTAYIENTVTTQGA